MASEIKVDTISEKTSAGGVTIDGLLIKDGGISGDVSLIGTTPTFTIGDAGAEDATLLFDGNAQDFYIALDDTADDLLIGLGATVGTTPAIGVDENLQVSVKVTTASTSASTGSLITGGGVGVGADLYVGDDTYLITDSAVLGFGADKDTLLTHTDGTGLTLNSTNKLCFNDTSQFVQGSSATVLSIGATDEIDLTATAIDINGTCDISGTFSLGGTNITTTAAEINLIDGGTSRGTTALADGDGVLINDGGTMRMTNVTTVKTYMGSAAGSEYFEATQAGGNQTITHNTVTKISFDAEELDSGTVYDKDTNYRFTVANAGIYLIGYDLNFNSSDANKIDNCYVYPYLNGSTFQLGSYNETAHGFRAQANPMSQISMSSTFMYEFDAGDYVEIFVNTGHTDGGANTFNLARDYANWWAIRIT